MATPVLAQDRTIRRALRILETRLKRHPTVLPSREEASFYLRLLFGGKEHEEFWALWLDARHALIDAEMLSCGTVDRTDVYPREVVKAALRHNARSVIFAHNHPSGSLIVSRADRVLTDALRDALSLIDVRLLDHFVVTAAETRSAL